MLWLIIELDIVPNMLIVSLPHHTLLLHLSPELQGLPQCNTVWSP